MSVRFNISTSQLNGDQDSLTNVMKALSNLEHEAQIERCHFPPLEIRPTDTDILLGATTKDGVDVAGLTEILRKGLQKLGVATLVDKLDIAISD